METDNMETSKKEQLKSLLLHFRVHQDEDILLANIMLLFKDREVIKVATLKRVGLRELTDEQHNHFMKGIYKHLNVVTLSREELIEELQFQYGYSRATIVKKGGLMHILHGKGFIVKESRSYYTIKIKALENKQL